MSKVEQLLSLINEDIIRDIEGFIRSSMAGGKVIKSDDLLDQAKKIYKDDDEFTIDVYRQAWKNMMQRGDLKRTKDGCTLTTSR